METEAYSVFYSATGTFVEIQGILGVNPIEDIYLTKRLVNTERFFEQFGLGDISTYVMDQRGNPNFINLAGEAVSVNVAILAQHGRPTMNVLYSLSEIIVWVKEQASMHGNELNSKKSERSIAATLTPIEIQSFFGQIQ